MRNQRSPRLQAAARVAVQMKVQMVWTTLWSHPQRPSGTSCTINRARTGVDSARSAVQQLQANASDLTIHTKWKSLKRKICSRN